MKPFCKTLAGSYKRPSVLRHIRPLMVRRIRLDPEIHLTEITMRKTILSVLGATLMIGLMVQVATAAEHQFHPTQDTPATAQDRYFRGAYDQWNGYYNDAPRTLQEERNLEDFGFSGRDLSRPGGEDPSLNPPGD
jgi:hypothetical protein